MSVQDLINARKAQEINGDEDFTVGTIAGLDNTPLVVPNILTQKAEEVSNMTTAKEEQVAVTPEQLEGTVELKLKKGYEKLVEIVVGNNDGVIVQSFNSYYQLNAKQIRVTRQDAERALGNMSNSRWRMILMNRKGDVSNFNDYELVLGVIENDIEETVKETAQVNCRIALESKVDMDSIRNLLGMTQTQFLEVAIKEFTDKVRAEML